MIDLNQAPESLRIKWMEEWLTAVLGIRREPKLDVTEVIREIDRQRERLTAPKAGRGPEERLRCSACGAAKAKRHFKLPGGGISATCTPCRIIDPQLQGYSVEKLPPAKARNQ
jgi:hypothetical protein